MDYSQNMADDEEKRQFACKNFENIITKYIN